MTTDPLPYTSKIRAKQAREAVWRPMAEAVHKILSAGPLPLIREDVVSSHALIRYLADEYQIYRTTPHHLYHVLRLEGLQQCTSTDARTLGLWARFGITDAEASQLAEARLNESLTRPRGAHRKALREAVHRSGVLMEDPAFS